jgi:hypothetical protein
MSKSKAVPTTCSASAMSFGSDRSGHNRFVRHPRPYNKPRSSRADLEHHADPPVVHHRSPLSVGRQFFRWDTCSESSWDLHSRKYTISHMYQELRASMLTDAKIDRLLSLLIDALFHDRKSKPSEWLWTNPRISCWLVKHRHRDFNVTQRHTACTLSPHAFDCVAIVYKRIGSVYNLLLWLLQKSDRRSDIGPRNCRQRGRDRFRGRWRGIPGHPQMRFGCVNYTGLIAIANSGQPIRDSI